MQRLPKFRRLHTRAKQARGLVVDRAGVALGPDNVLVQRSPLGYRCAAPEVLGKLVHEVFDDDRHLHALPQRLAAIARALEVGDLAKAQLLALAIPLHDLDDRQLSPLAHGDLLKAGFDPDQPRDAYGQWSADGGAPDGVQVADSQEGLSDAGGILPASGSGSRQAAEQSASGTKVRELSPEEAKQLPPPPAGSKYVTLNDGSVLWSAYANGGRGGPMLMPADVSLAANVAFGERLRADYERDAPCDKETGDAEINAAMVVQFFHGPMDYQEVYGSKDKYNKDYIDFGNYNYGIVAAAAGYSWSHTMHAAGVVNLLGRGDKSLELWGNNPRNLAMIKNGYGDYMAGKIGSKSPQSQC